MLPWALPVAKRKSGADSTVALGEKVLPGRDEPAGSQRPISIASVVAGPEEVPRAHYPPPRQLDHNRFLPDVRRPNRPPSSSTGACLSVTTFDADTTEAALEAERSIRYWYLDRRASAKVMVPSWTNEAYRQAVDRSLLKPPVRKTLHAMVDNSVGGLTTIDRASLCRIAGLKDVKTITTHFKKARSAGLLESVQRLNKSSIHTLLIPGIDASAGDKQQGGQLAP